MNSRTENLFAEVLLPRLASLLLIKNHSAESGNALRTQSRPGVLGSAGVLRYYGRVIAEQKGETLPPLQQHTYVRNAVYGSVLWLIAYYSF